ncbi:MAG: transcription repressor NadR [Lachnospiraceae bacterium]|nr:transcription repressor NadR [Lachnospiraceae bacterium]
MDGSERRERIIAILTEEKEAVSGSRLAKQLGVSRQVIVQDIALLRTAHPVLATAQGYVLYSENGGKARRAFLVRHTKDEIADELNTIVDAGGKILNVIVEHDLYGQISADLNVANRREVEAFCTRLATSRCGPLYMITGGIHIHTVEAESEEILDYLESQLREKKYLICD